MKILVSKCLVGIPCKYNGKSNYNSDLFTFLDCHEVYLVCPEIDGGLSIPRSPSEIKEGLVINKDGIDVSASFKKGANKALEICKKHDIKYAILKANSPSCGCGKIYDGTFSNTLIKGDGVTASILLQNGIKVFNENNYLEILKENRDE